MQQSCVFERANHIAAPEEMIDAICAVPKRPSCPHVLDQAQHVRGRPAGPCHVATIPQRKSWDHEEGCLPRILRAYDFITQLHDDKRTHQRNMWMCPLMR
eukprot:364356-Chlamydomonas_euryale.AAC.8